VRCLAPGVAMSNSVTRDQRHTRQHRCPICDGADQDPRGKGKRCSGFTNEDAGYTHCSREDLAGSIDGKDVQGVTLFAHRLHGSCRCGVEHGPARTETRDTIEATYTYVDEAGAVLFEVVRKTGKKFLQRRPVPGGWEWKIGDVRRVLYRLLDLHAADPSTVVYIVEGEKDVAALERAGALATCNPGGAGKWSLVAAHAREVLKGRTVIVIADKDGERQKFAGQKHALEIQASLRDVATVTLMQAPDPHKDAADMLAAGLSLDALVPFKVPSVDEPPKPPPPTPLRVVPASNLPEIRIGAALHRMVAEAITALATDDTIFQKSNQLVHVVRATTPPKIRKDKVIIEPGMPVIRAIELPTLKERLSSCAQWLRYNKKDKKCEPARPDGSATQSVFTRRHWPGIRSLVGITMAPTFRSDGSILQTPGFDDATGLLFLPNAPYPAVPLDPTRDDARDAYRNLCSVTELGDGGFPFAAPHHKAAWVCAVLSILARFGIEGPVPLFAVDANTQGTGKSILADAAVRIALGYPSPRMSFPENDEEMRKRITMLVMSGARTALIDNINRKFGGDSIENAITTPVWLDRVLGTNAEVNETMQIVFLANGNGLDYTRDMRTRTVHIRLESPLENPESRVMPDLSAWIEARRHHLVTWALTMLRAWHVAGRPKSTKTIGRFAAWGEMIPQAVAWASDIDPTHAFATDDPEADTDRIALNAMLECVEHLANPHVSAKQIIATLYGSNSHDGTTMPDHHPSFPGAREAIEGITGAKSGVTPDAIRLGRFFSKKLGTIVAGRKLAMGPISAGVKMWKVVKA